MSIQSRLDRLERNNVPPGCCRSCGVAFDDIGIIDVSFVDERRPILGKKYQQTMPDGSRRWCPWPPTDAKQCEECGKIKTDGLVYAEPVYDAAEWERLISQVQ